MISPISLFPCNAGDRVRIWHIAQGLARHSQVTLVLPASTPDDALLAQRPMASTDQLRLVSVPTAAVNHWRKLKSIVARWPYHVALRYDQTIHQTVTALLDQQSYTLVYCHFLHTLPYVADVNLPLILDQHNVDRIYWQRKLLTQPPPHQRWLIRHNLAKTIRFEEQALPILHGIVSVSEVDRRATATYAKPTVPHLLVAPNGVDPAHYRYQPPPVTAPRKLTLGFLGSLELAINQEAVLTLLQTIYPAVQQQLPDWQVTVLVIGRQPPTWLRDWSQSHPAHSVTVTGDVPDVLPYLHQVDLLVLPLESGAGTKLRVLEAMAAGVCVVGSPLAFAGLDQVTLGQHAHVAAQPDAFVAAICQLASDPTRRRQISQQARAVVEAEYSWQKITDQLAYEIKTIYEK